MDSTQREVSVQILANRVITAYTVLTPITYEETDTYYELVMSLPVFNTKTYNLMENEVLGS